MICSDIKKCLIFLELDYIIHTPSVLNISEKNIFKLKYKQILIIFVTLNDSILRMSFI